MNPFHEIQPGRPVVHPGPVATQRVTAVVGTTRPHSAASLPLIGHDAAGDAPSGTSLLDERPLTDALIALVEAAGADSGIVEFATAELPRVSYCFPATGDDLRPMLYSATHESSGIVLQGTATIGFRTVSGADITEGRERWVHAHASWVDRTGSLRGGHLWPPTTVRGNLTHATVWPLHGITLVNTEDDETQLPVFTPRPSAGTDGSRDPSADRAAVFARVRPNEEIADVIAALTHEHVLAGGHVRGGTGSLVGAHFADGGIAEGPATEVISLAGSLLPDGRAPALACSLITAEGEVRAGRLSTTGNLVGATYDLMLTGPGPHVLSS